MSDRPRKKRDSTQGWELQLRQRNSNIPVRTGEDRQVSEGTESFYLARSDWAICCNSEVVELTEGKPRRKELSTRGQVGRRKISVSPFLIPCLATLCFLCFGR